MKRLALCLALGFAAATFSPAAGAADCRTAIACQMQLRLDDENCEDTGSTQCYCFNTYEPIPGRVCAP